MHIWVDGDACPGETKEMLFKASLSRQVPLTIVANQSPSGMNIADF